MDINCEAAKETIRTLLTNNVALTSTLAVFEAGAPRHKPKTVTSGHVSTRVCLRGKRGNNLHPSFKPGFQFRSSMQRAMQKLVETLSKSARAFGVR